MKCMIDNKNLKENNFIKNHNLQTIGIKFP